MTKKRSALDQHYAAALAAHGEGPRAVSWGSALDQQLAFCELLGVGDLSSGTVLDVGCGRGGLLTLLGALFPSARYTGIDVNPEMIAAARAAHEDARFEVFDITTAPFTERHDWVLAAGIFNLTELPHAEQLQRVRRGLQQMLASARRGVACSFLSRRCLEGEVFPGEGALRFHHEDPAELLGAALELTPRVSLRQGTCGPRGLTLYLYREDDEQEQPAVQAVLEQLAQEPPAVDELHAALEYFGALVRLRRVPEARAYAEALPPGPVQTFLQAQLLYYYNRLPEVAEALAEILDDLPEALETRGEILVLLGRERELLDETEPRLDRSSEAHLTRFVHCCLAAGQPERGRPALEHLPNRALRALLEARLAQAQGDPDRARAARERYQEAAPYAKDVLEDLE